VPIGVPDQINRTFTDGLPVKYLDRILHDVNFDQGSGRNQLSHGVIFQTHHGIAESPGIKAFAQRRWQRGQLLRIQFEQAGLVAVEGGIEVELKAELRLSNFCGLRPRQAGFRLAGVLPHLVQVNSENEKEFLQRDFEACGQTEQFVNAGDRSGFYISQRGVGNVKIRVTFHICDRAADAFNITGFYKSLFP
jgi:hypothetical protein